MPPLSSLPSSELDRRPGSSVGTGVDRTAGVVLARPAGRVTGGGTGVVGCGVTGRVDGSVGVAAVNVVVDGGTMPVVV
jgi:hypothetical protein